MPDWYLHPPLPLALVMVLLGFWLLIKGADLLVEGAVVVARRFDLTPAVIGATVVAFGTSLPELMVSLFSALAAAREGSFGDADGPAAIAVSNVVGSNIFNIGAVLGLSALVRILPVPPTSRRIDYPLVVLSGVLLILFSVPIAGDPAFITRWEGALLCAGLVGFVVIAVRMGGVLPEELPESLPENALAAVGLILIGILMLGAGGDVTLNGALTLARSMGMSERVIGLTVMAIGTSLPELVTSVQAARRGQTEMAVANVLGSNCFNVLCIIGISALVVQLPVSRGTLAWDYWWMLGFPLVLLPALYLRGRIGRPTGVVLVSALVVYVTLVLVFDEGAAPPAPDAVDSAVPAAVP